MQEQAVHARTAYSLHFAQRPLRTAVVRRAAMQSCSIVEPTHHQQPMWRPHPAPCISCRRPHKPTQATALTHTQRAHGPWSVKLLPGLQELFSLPVCLRSHLRTTAAHPAHQQQPHHLHSCRPPQQDVHVETTGRRTQITKVCWRACVCCSCWAGARSRNHHSYRCTSYTTCLYLTPARNATHHTYT